MSLVFREAIQVVRRTPVVAVMTSLTISMAIGLGSVMAFISYKAHEALNEMRSRIEIEAFFDPALGSSDAEHLTEKSIRVLPGIAQAIFTSKEAALEEYRASTGEDVEEVLGFNPLPASVRVHLNSTTSGEARRLAQSLRSIRGVHEVQYDIAGLLELESRADGLRLLSLIVGGLLLLAAIAFVHSTTRLAIYARRETIGTMELLGATWFVIRAPYAMEGAAAGFVGGIAGGGIFLLIGSLVLGKITPGLQIISLEFDRGLLVIAISAIGGLLLGGVTGLLSSILGLARVFRQRE